MMALNRNLAHEEVIVLNILTYRYCVNKSQDISRNHFAKNCKLLSNDELVAGLRHEIEQ